MLSLVVNRRMARLRAALRRGNDQADEPRIVRTDSLVIDLDARLAHRDGVAVHLTPTEWRLLSVLTRRPGTLIRQADLLREVWGPTYGRETSYLRVYLAQLRRKLEQDPESPDISSPNPASDTRFVP